MTSPPGSPEPPGRPVGPVAGAVVASPRVGVAQVALRAALALDGVAGPHRGALVGARVTAPGGELLPAITAVGRGDGRYDVRVALIARPVPLQALADRVRDAVGTAMRRAKLDQALGRVDVAFTDVDASSHPEGGPE